MSDIGKIVKSEVITYWWGEGMQQALVLETEDAWYVYPNVKLEISALTVNPNVVEGEEHSLYGEMALLKDNNFISHLNLNANVTWTAYPAPTTCTRNLIMSHTDINRPITDTQSESIMTWILK